MQTKSFHCWASSVGNPRSYLFQSRTCRKHHPNNKLPFLHFVFWQTFGFRPTCRVLVLYDPIPTQKQETFCWWKCDVPLWCKCLCRAHGWATMTLPHIPPCQNPLFLQNILTLRCASQMIRTPLSKKQKTNPFAIFLEKLCYNKDCHDPKARDM